MTALSIADKIEEAYEYLNGNGQIGKIVVVPYRNRGLADTNEGVEHMKRGNHFHRTQGGMTETTAHRCGWAESDPLLRSYHDEEWGVTEFDSRALWEKLMLDGFQAGLSWLMILRKRDSFRT